jgi:hypothetical protein
MSSAVRMKITRSATFVGDARWDVLIFASGVWAHALGSVRANCVTNREPFGRSRGFGARLAGATSAQHGKFNEDTAHRSAPR